ncbi:glycosyl transferase family 2 [Roseimicrobium gellanilyticum]|uniref:Glycosyl transferase family 2 n=1 Tax=Roseimicrobium gellanilyticum TaxID=748857 RepID=A0A366HV57_9BACT|nr:glycosyltransferase family 2 protein [Roseimicrobium gellanilyticum]RBP46587.1 glycosyl transferase family 2 [Roseimicrobium gellanilyticum]
MPETSAPHEMPLAVKWFVDDPKPRVRALSPHEVLVRGWMFALDGSPMHGVVRIAEMPDVAFTQTTNRDDVVTHFRGQHEVPTQCGFQLQVPLPASNSTEVELTLLVAIKGSENFSPPTTVRIRRMSALPWPAPPLRSTVISHFYNEEYLLPLWLRHHLPLFDHGILINRGSTDRSVEICRELAPHWEVRNATCPEFDAEEVDKEVMAVEREITGWKFALNTTEFLHVHSRDSFYAALHLWSGQAYAIGMAYLMDPKEAAYPEFDTSRPIAAQRHHGWLRPVFGYRYIHRFEDGNYTVGRHLTLHPTDVVPLEAAVLLKLFLTPWNEPFKRRRLQIRPTLSQKSIALGQGSRHHVATEGELEDYYHSKIAHSSDLRREPRLQWLFAPNQPNHRRQVVDAWRELLRTIITACSHALGRRKRPDDSSR